MIEFPELQLWQHAVIALVFTWGGFVRTGLGFGGAALALPFLLLVLPDPIVFLPVISVHLLFFASLTLFDRLKEVDWGYILRAQRIMALPFFLGLFGLIQLPGAWLSLFVFGVTFVYALTYIFNYQFQSNHRLADAALLGLGGYVSGTSLIGAPLIVAVFTRHVPAHRLRNTLFVLWILFVSAKLGTFVALDVPLYFAYALLLLPFAWIGHIYGLKAHDALLASGSARFQRVIGVVMLVVTVTGVWQALASDKFGI